LFRHSRLFDPKDRATLHYVLLLTRAAATVREQVLEDLKKYYNETQIVELTLVICVANFTNRLNDGLLATPDLG
jgi:alkylhydroperoxidase family enzyme